MSIHTDTYACAVEHPDTGQGLMLHLSHDRGMFPISSSTTQWVLLQLEPHLLATDCIVSTNYVAL